MSSELPSEMLDGMEKIQEEVISAIRATINSVHEVWVEIYGIEDSLNSARVDDLKTKILNFCDALQDQAENQKNTLIKRVESVLKEIVELEQLLDVEGHSVKDYKNIDVPLVEMDCQLWSILSKYRAEKDQRMEKLKTLQEKQQTICSFLNLPVPSLNLQNGSIPTPTELKKLEEEIYKLEVQQRDMLDDFYESRKAVASLIKELDIIPVLKCEMAAVKENDIMFPPNRKNLEEIKLAQQNLMLKLKNVKLEADELRAKLKEMWLRCKWDPNDLKKILNRHNGHSKVDISQLKAELKICEEERRTHMKEFIMDLREEIDKYWNLCYFSEEDRKKFKTFYTNDYNEDVLIIHEIELENLKKHYEKYKNIFKLTEKRKEFWDRLKSIEQATKDPNRLFRNRGGQLLQEEKERRTIQKELPKIEEELQECITEYEKETGSPFYMYGHNLKDMIKSEWDNWQANKDSLKKARKIANAHIIEVESKLGARTMIGTKRKMPPSRQNNDVSNNKIPKLGGQINQTTLYNSTRQHKPVSQLRSEPHGKFLTRGRHEVIPTVSPFPATSTPFVSFTQTSPNLASYISFEQQLEKTQSSKGGLCQNTLKVPTADRVLRARNLPNAVLRTPNKPSRIPTNKTPIKTLMKTPIKTPMKTPMQPLVKTPSKSPFRIATGSKIPAHVEPMKSPSSSSRTAGLKLTPARGKLPIII